MSKQDNYFLILHNLQSTSVVWVPNITTQGLILIENTMHQVQTLPTYVGKFCKYTTVSYSFVTHLF